MAILHTRPIRHTANPNPTRKAKGNMKSVAARAYMGPTGFNPPGAVFIYDPVTNMRFTTQTGQIPGYVVDPRYGRKVLKNRLNVRTITD